MNEIKQCQKELAKYPSFLEIRQYIERKPHVERCLQKLKKELEFGYEEDIEYTRTFNLIAFLSIELGDNDTAKTYIDKTLKKDRNDIIALVNKGLYCLKSEDVSECIEVCENLKQLKITDVDDIYAKAQIAYSYSRIGTAAYEKSIEYYTKVLEKAEKIKKVPDFHIVLWNFGFGLTRKRILHVLNVPHIGDEMLSAQKYEEALKPHLRNMFIKTTSKYRARSIVSIAELVYSLEKIGGNSFEILRKSLNLETSSHYLNEALRIGHDDYFVLERCGKQFRYARNIKQSKECLMNALDKRETSFAHHHLALSLKRELELEHTKHKIKRKQNPRQFSRDSSVPRNFCDPKQKFRLKPGECLPKRMANMSHFTSTRKYGGSRRHVVKNEDSTLETDFGNLAISSNAIAQSHNQEKASKKEQGVWQDNGYINNNKKRMMKSPRHVISLDSHKTDKILHHLNEAVKENTNLPSLYEKGLLYRSTNQFDLAKDTFQEVRKHPDITPAMLANAYEQSAYCLLDSLEDPENEEKDKKNARFYLKMAMEIQCYKIVNKIPNLKESWSGIPTLKDLLSCNVMSKTNLRDLIHLKECIEEYNGAVEACFQLIDLDPDAEENFETYMKIVKMYLKQNDNTGAILTLNMIRILPDWSEKIDSDLYIQVQIQGAIDSYQSENKLLAKERFQNAIRFGTDSNTHEKQLDSEEDENTDTFDVLILSQSFETQGVTLNLLNLLKTVGINATANNVDIIYGTPEVTTMAKILKECECFIIVCDSPDEPQSFDFIRYFKCIEFENHENGRNRIAVVKFSEFVEVQMTLRIYPSIVACSGIKQQDCEQHFDPDTVQWVKELLMKLLCKT